MSAPQRTIVVIHPGGLGDVLLSLGALVALRTAFPHHELVLLAGLEVGTLLIHCGVIDHVWSLESSQMGAMFTGGEQLSGEQHAVFGRCDLVVGWLSDHSGSLRRTMRELGVSRVILQSPASIEGLHQSARFLQVLQREIRAELRPSLDLHLPEQVRQSGVDALRASGIGESCPLIVCHPGSGSVHKCVSPGIWGTLFQGCHARQWLPVVLLGPADEQSASAIRELSMSELPVLRPASVTKLAGILSQAQGVIGHDSGVTHLAALLGVPSVAMFGPTDEQRWAPQGPQVTVVRGEICACKGWDAVRACREKPCLSIDPEEVLKALDRIEFRYPRVTNS